MEAVAVLTTLMTFLLQGDTPPTPPPTETPTPDCYGTYGCFPLDGPWSSIERPISLSPLPPHAIMPIFCLHTPARPHCQELLVDDLTTLANLTLTPGSPLVFITHGYLESTSLEWVGRLVRAVVGAEVSLVTVDWSVAAPPPYARSVSNVRLVAAITGHLIHLLKSEAGLRLEDVHLIGHSLGAHLMAYVGAYMINTYDQKVGRITGLDPAGPYFLGTPPEVRLDPSDATFVDIVHTDIPANLFEIDKLGYPDPLGHVDFYPNGGSDQAGCQGSAVVHITKKRTLAGGLVSYLGCDHQRAYEYLINSVRQECSFLGVVCGSWAEYRAGACWGCEDGGCGRMGFPATPITRVTPSSSPIPPGHGDGGMVRVAQGGQGRQGRRRHSGATPETTHNNGDGRNIEVPHEEEEKWVPIKVYMGTSPETPFCAEQYAVTVVTSSSPESVRGGGDLALFTVTLKGPHVTHTIMPPHKSAFVEVGESYRWAGWSAVPLAELYSLQVEYQEDEGFLNSLIWRFSPPTLYVEAFTIQALSTGHIQEFPFCGERMQAGQSYTLLLTTQCSQTNTTL